ncbi:MAG TPA: diacylglycerol kinase family protein [bacterium]|nr:diacylglycerol kinase family protein [bacterium]
MGTQALGAWLAAFLYMFILAGILLARFAWARGNATSRCTVREALAPVPLGMGTRSAAEERRVNERWAIIYNPTSGNRRTHVLEAVQRALHGEGVSCQVLSTQGPGHATELARAVQGVDRLAVYGGDGTFNEVARGMLGRATPLVFVPGGTANVMAYELGLPRNPVAAALAALRGRARPVHPGRVGKRPFLLMAGVGFDGAAVHGVSPELKRRFGKAAYVWAGLQALWQGGPTLRLGCADQSVAQAVWVVAARGRHYAGPYTIHPGARLEAASLGVVAVAAGAVAPFLIAQLALGWHHRSRRVRLCQSAAAWVESDKPVHLQVDGDYAGQDVRFEFGICPEAVSLCFPANQP